MAHVLNHWFKQVPIVTRCYLTATVLTTVACYLEIVTPSKLYLNPKFVVNDFQLWRLFTNCFFLGSLGWRFFIRLYYIADYSKELEERVFRGRTADYCYMILFGAMVMTCIVMIGSIVPYVSEKFVSIYFLSYSLIFMMVYLWSKYNPSIMMNFFGFKYASVYHPWVLLALSVFLKGNGWGDFLGIVAGHAYYYLAEIYPRMTGRRPLRTPSFIKSMFAHDAAVVRPVANARFPPPAEQERNRDD